jgi:hypothetical protein
MIEDFDIEIDDALEAQPYTVNGVAVPRVTDILRLARKPFEKFLSKDDLVFYQTRGQSGHSTAELILKKQLDRRTIAKAVKPFMASWERVIEEYQLEVLVVEGVVFAEVPMTHDLFRYGTRIDALMRCGKRRGRIGVWEWKFTSAHSSATPKQTASHKLASNFHLKKHFPHFREEVVDRFAARLTQTGKPDVREHKSPADEGLFLSYLNVYRDMQANKLL